MGYTMLNGIQYGGGGGSGTEVIANPENLSEGAVELTGLRVNNNDYKISQNGAAYQIYIGDTKPTDENVLLWVNTSETYEFIEEVGYDIWFKDGSFMNTAMCGEPTYWNESSATVALDEDSGLIYINKNSLASGSNQAFVYMTNLITDDMKNNYKGIEVEYFISRIISYGGKYGAKVGFFASKNTYVAKEYTYINVTDDVTTIQLDFSLIPEGETRYFGFGGNITGYVKSVKLIQKQ